MNSALHIIRVILAVGLGIAGTAALVWFPNLAVPLFAGSIAWSLMPEN